MSKLALRLIAKNKKHKTKSLDLGDCGLTEIPDELGELVWLETLYLNNKSEIHIGPYKGDETEALTLLKWYYSLFGKKNQINHLNKRISNLKNLRILNINGQNISDLSLLAGLTNLQVFSCVKTQTSDLSPLAGLKNLQSINCSETQVINLSPLEGLINLQVLDCQITEISDLVPIAGLTSLQKLSFPQTKVSNLGPLAGLINLELLSISTTQVFDLAPILGLIKKGLLVKWEYCDETPGIFLKDCPISNPPIQVVRNGSEAILKYFSEITHKRTFLNTEVKCILLGNTAVGKSSLADFLTKKKYAKDKSSTHGIHVDKWETEFQGQKLSIYLWDFGGQEYYHATHRLFFSQNAVYCLVWDAATNQDAVCETIVFYNDDPIPHSEEVEHYPVHWWLRNVRHFTRDSTPPVPVLLVQNKTERDGYRDITFETSGFDLESEWIDNHLSIEKAAEHHLDQQPHTQKWARRFEDFEEKLLETLQNKCSRYIFPVYCHNVREEVNELKKSQKWLSRADFEALCWKYDGTAEIELIDIYLRDITGEILFYPNNGQLNDRVFLDSTWVCDQIYKVLSRELRTKNRGVFDAVWAENALEMDAKETERFLEIMREFELIFDETNENGNMTGQFVVPQYLSETCPDPSRLAGQLEVAEPHHVFTIWFPDFLPKSIMARFIAMHGLAAQQKLYWKNGLCFKIAGCQAFVERTIGNKIQVNIQPCEGRERAARQILNTFLKIEEDTPGFAISVDGQQFVWFRDLEQAYFACAKRVKKLSKDSKVSNKFIDVYPFNIFKPEDMKDREPLNIFISYSKHDREKFLEPMLRYLNPLVRGGLIKPWDDSQILPGEEWDMAIKNQIKEADVIFLLVSTNSLNTDYIWNVEIEAAMCRHHEGTARVIPIILCKCLWTEKDRDGNYIFPPAKLNALPVKGKPVKEWENQEDAWDAVASGIKAILKNL